MAKRNQDRFTWTSTLSRAHDLTIISFLKSAFKDLYEIEKQIQQDYAAYAENNG